MAYALTMKFSFVVIQSLIIIHMDSYSNIPASVNEGLHASRRRPGLTVFKKLSS
jgi:hypothetical protein